jgi:uncharacterized protein YndB with AHSA1/START domain
MPERIYRAFLDGDAMAKWLPPNGFTGKVHHMDAKVGGTNKMSFSNFTTGKSHSFGGTYLELSPHEHIHYTNEFDDTDLPGEMQTMITLKQVFCGTELNITQKGIPAAIPVEACYLGWQESLNSSRLKFRIGHETIPSVLTPPERTFASASWKHRSPVQKESGRKKPLLNRASSQRVFEDLENRE